MQGWLGLIEMIQVSHPFLHAGMKGVGQGVPLHAGFVIPLRPLPEFIAHEEEFLAGLGKHVAEE